MSEPTPQEQRDMLQWASYIQLSRILDVLYFQSKDLPGFDQLEQAHAEGRLFGPEPYLEEPE